MLWSENHFKLKAIHFFVSDIAQKAEQHTEMGPAQSCSRIKTAMQTLHPLSDLFSLLYH